MAAQQLLDLITNATVGPCFKVRVKVFHHTCKTCFRVRVRVRV
jgi:hypothetical protein